MEIKCVGYDRVVVEKFLEVRKRGTNGKLIVAENKKLFWGGTLGNHKKMGV